MRAWGLGSPSQLGWTPWAAVLPRLVTNFLYVLPAATRLRRGLSLHAHLGHSPRVVSSARPLQIYLFKLPRRVPFTPILIFVWKLPRWAPLQRLDMPSWSLKLAPALKPRSPTPLLLPRG